MYTGHSFESEYNLERFIKGPFSFWIQRLPAAGLVDAGRGALIEALLSSRVDKYLYVRGERTGPYSSDDGVQESRNESVLQ